MSRIGRTPIVIPTGVSISMIEGRVVVKGPKGELKTRLNNDFKLVQDNNTLEITCSDKEQSSKHGLVRSLVNNMVIGVSKGWEKSLELVGVGYKAQGSSNEIILSVGFSHPIKFTAPLGITFQINDNTKITVTGIDKKLVGEVTAQIRSIRPPEPYKGKGIRYKGEIVRKKAGKAVKATSTSGGS